MRQDLIKKAISYIEQYQDDAIPGGGEIPGTDELLEELREEGKK